MEGGVDERADTNEAAMSIERESDAPLGEQDAQRRKREHGCQQQAGNKSQMMQNKFRWVSPDTRVLADENRPHRPEPRNDDQDPDDCLRAEKFFQKSHGVIFDVGGVPSRRLRSISG